MGFRMSIRSEQSDEWIGDDHKFYGYYSYEKVKNSFNFLYPFMVQQWENFNYDKFDNPEEEAYSTLCAIGATPDLEVDHNSFIYFAKKYIRDLKDAEWDRDALDYITKYLNELCDTPGHKFLQWC